MTRTQWARAARSVVLICLFGVPAAQAQTFTTIANLPKPLQHLTQLIQGEDGNLLGTNSGGGAPYGVGLIVRVSLTGQLSQLYRFCLQTSCPDGEFPEGLYQTPNGTMYGLTDGGGASGNGVLFQLSRSGKETVLYNFCSQANCGDGMNPTSAPVPSVNGGLIATASGGGAYGQGTLFKVSPTGDLTTLYSFCAQANCTDGAVPKTPPLQMANGVIYGTTENGGKNASGNVYAFTPQGKLVNLYSFPSADPFVAVPRLIQGSDGNLYGVTQYGGAATNDGSVFKITPQGNFTNLYNFCPLSNCADGAAPVSLIQGSDGNLYGTTQGGGNPNDAGTIFKITPQGVLTTLYTFCQGSTCIDGENPQSLMQDTNGVFYGTTGGGGSLGGGTVFSLSLGLAPFVRTSPGFGKVGAKIGILGTNLTGTTSVTINGTAAAFTVVSDSYIMATVPNGATSGNVEATTSSGTLNSNMPFQVLP